MKDKDELKQNVLDPSADVMDIILQLSENELLKDVPIVGLGFKIAKASRSISDFIFLKKVLGFIETVDNKTTKQERIEFANKLKEDEKEKEKIYTGVFLRIDKFDDVSKPDLFAKIFACFITNKIKEEDYHALADVLNLASREVLKAFSNSYWDTRKPLHNAKKLYRSNYDSLLSTGLVKLNLEGKIQNSGLSHPVLYNLDFKVTELGRLYVYITEDFEDYFSLLSDLERSYISNTGRIYSFKNPFSKET